MKKSEIKKAAGILGSMTSKKKVISSRKNGKLGGRPKLIKVDKSKVLKNSPNEPLDTSPNGNV